MSEVNPIQIKIYNHRKSIIILILAISWCMVCFVNIDLGPVFRKVVRFNTLVNLTTC